MADTKETSDSPTADPGQAGGGAPPPANPDWLAGADLPSRAGLPSWLDMELPDFLQGPAEPPPAAAAAASAPPVPEADATPAVRPESSANGPPVPVRVREEAPATSEAEPAPGPVALDPALPAAAEAPPAESPAASPPAEKPGATPGHAQTFAYGISARSGRSSTVHQVRVEHELPAGATCVASEPRGQVLGSRIVWHVGRWEPGVELTFKVKIRLAPGQTLPPGAEAAFKIYQCLQAHTRIAAPRLALVVTGPDAAPLGEPVRLRVQVSNRGSGPATGVVLSDHLPPGLRGPQGDRYRASLGTLEPGQARDVVIEVKGVQGGRHDHEVVATCQEGTKAVAPVALLVTEPALALRLTGPASARVGQPLEFRLEVSNPGSGPAAEVRVTAPVPAGFDFLAADGGGRFDPAGRVLAWEVGKLAPDRSRVLNATLVAAEAGNLSWEVRADARPDLEAKAAAAVRVESPQDPPEGSDCRDLDALVAAIDGEVGRAFGPAAATAGQAPLAAAADVGGQYVLFRLAGTDYAVPIGNVVEMSRPLPATPVPQVPEWVLGVANVRGDIVSLIDLRAFLGLGRPERPADQRLLVARSRQGEVTAGLLVDQVHGMRRLPGSPRPPAAPVRDRVAPYLEGVADYRGGLVAVLDLDRLLLAPEMRQFGTTSDAAAR